ncbi:hypothetical protein Y032_0013g2036 [Ancylostoma ceylanicum]|nr:hypothetical protein Y032_0013g2036 [Ancylostoma ceylanicum]
MRRSTMADRKMVIRTGFLLCKNSTREYSESEMNRDPNPLARLQYPSITNRSLHVGSMDIIMPRVSGFGCSFICTLGGPVCALIHILNLDNETASSTVATTTIAQQETKKPKGFFPFLQLVVCKILFTSKPTRFLGGKFIDGLTFRLNRLPQRPESGSQFVICD